MIQQTFNRLLKWFIACSAQDSNRFEPIDWLHEILQYNGHEDKALMLVQRSFHSPLCHAVWCFSTPCLLFAGEIWARCCVTQDKQWIMSGHNECATWVWLLSDLDAIKTEERNFFGFVLFTGSCVVKAFGTSRAGSNPANSKVILNVQTAHLSSDSTPLVALYKSVFSQS